jgi:glucokinase
MAGIEIGIDLGATRIKGVVVENKGNVLYQVYSPTQDGGNGVWKKAMAEIVDELKHKTKHEVAGIGIAAPGLPNADYTAIAVMPGRLEGLENFIWKDFLGSPTVVLNDAVAAMMAEARFGAARNKMNVIMLTLGTGVGGAILIEGKPYLGAFNKAGHIGHMVINDEGDRDVTGIPGSLEDAIGDTTLKKRSQGKFLSTRELLEAYRNGDVYAKEVWLTSVKKLAIGIASLTNILSPETVVLGGGIAESGIDLFEPLKEFLATFEWRAGGHKVEIVKAKYGDMAGAIGAACFAMQHANLRE